jgi:hypothetical protein
MVNEKIRNKKKNDQIENINTRLKKKYVEFLNAFFLHKNFSKYK